MGGLEPLAEGLGGVGGAEALDRIAEEGLPCRLRHDGLRGGLVGVGGGAGAHLLEGMHHVHPILPSRSPGPLHPAAELLQSGGRPPGEVGGGLGGGGVRAWGPGAAGGERGPVVVVGVAVPGGAGAAVAGAGGGGRVRAEGGTRGGGGHGAAVARLVASGGAGVLVAGAWGGGLVWVAGETGARWGLWGEGEVEGGRRCRAWRRREERERRWRGLGPGGRVRPEGGGGGGHGAAMALVVPGARLDGRLQWAHHSSGHTGCNRFAALIIERFYCRLTQSELRARMQSIVDSCDCHASKQMDSRDRGPVSSLPITYCANSLLYADFIHGLPKFGGYDSCLVVTCGLTRFTRAFPCNKKITGEQTVKILVEEWFEPYGASKETHSDEDGRIRSDTGWYKRVLDALNVQVTTGVPYTHTSNPIRER